jgi:hypothetical protein
MGKVDHRETRETDITVLLVYFMKLGREWDGGQFPCVRHQCGKKWDFVEKIYWNWVPS